MSATLVVMLFLFLNFLDLLFLFLPLNIFKNICFYCFLERKGE